MAVDNRTARVETTSEAGAAFVETQHCLQNAPIGTISYAPANRRGRTGAAAPVPPPWLGFRCGEGYRRSGMSS
jgi:hypothetical protein